jgi:4-hydroxy-4-methyl-2-oxoglutarate aldolase
VSGVWDELADLGSATVYEAAGRRGLVDASFVRVVPGSRAAGPARTVRCGQDDNLMVHAVMERVEPGDVLVLTMPEPAAVALVGELLATQAAHRRAAALLVVGAVRDVDELAAIGLPVWARWVRIRGATKTQPGAIDEPVDVAGCTIEPGDAVVLDADGVAVVPRARIDDVLAASHARADKERDKRAALESGALSYDLDGLRALVEP